MLLRKANKLTRGFCSPPGGKSRLKWSSLTPQTRKIVVQYTVGISVAGAIAMTAYTKLYLKWKESKDREKLEAEQASIKK